MPQHLTATLDTDASMAAVDLDWNATNLVINPSFETNATSWSAARGTITRTVGTSAFGAAYLAYVSTDGSTAGGNQAYTALTAITAGKVYTASAYIKAQVTGSPYSIYLNWYDAGSVFVGQNVYTSDGNLSGAVYTRLSVTGTAPVGATQVRVLIAPTLAMPNGSGFNLDGVALTEGPLLDYFDGSIAGYQWAGTANNSASTATLPATATVVRVNVATGTIQPVRNAEPATLVAGGWAGQDYEVPLDEEFYYRATSTTSPVIIESPHYTMPSNGLTYLKHPGQPALNMVVNPSKGPDLTRPVAQGVFDVLGRDFPVAVSMRRSSARGTLELVTFTDEEAANLVTILTDGTPLLLATPSGYGLGNRYIAVSDLDETRVSKLGYEQTRAWSLPFITVDRPAGAALATGNTWADVNSTYATWDALLAGEGTWSGVVAGVGS